MIDTVYNSISLECWTTEQWNSWCLKNLQSKELLRAFGGMSGKEVSVLRKEEIIQELVKTGLSSTISEAIYASINAYQHSQEVEDTEKIATIEDRILPPASDELLRTQEVITQLSTGITESAICEEFLEKDSFVIPHRAVDCDKMTVVLDMDETLLHSIFLRDISHSVEDHNEKMMILRQFKDNSNVVINVCGGVAVFFRPGLHTFLEKLSKICEVVLWTAAHREYAEPILKYIDPDDTLLPYRLYREHTVQHGQLGYVKDLLLLGRNMERTFLVDNSPMIRMSSPSNSILIEDFYGDPNDTELEEIWTLIKELDKFADVRPHLEMKASRTVGGNLYDEVVSDSSQCQQDYFDK